MNSRLHTDPVSDDRGASGDVPQAFWPELPEELQEHIIAYVFKSNSADDPVFIKSRSLASINKLFKKKNSLIDWEWEELLWQCRKFLTYIDTPIGRVAMPTGCAAMLALRITRFLINRERVANGNITTIELNEILECVSYYRLEGRMRERSGAWHRTHKDKIVHIREELLDALGQSRYRSRQKVQWRGRGCVARELSAPHLGHEEKKRIVERLCRIFHDHDRHCQAMEIECISVHTSLHKDVLGD
tara:strand:+ start:132 stop:866 length:735 start_codon:yes stop_codon:yes gene_type:complete